MLLNCEQAQSFNYFIDRLIIKHSVIKTLKRSFDARAFWRLNTQIVYNIPLCDLLVIFRNRCWYFY